MKLKPKKCLPFQPEVEFLGRIIKKDQLGVSVRDTQVVANWPVPTSSKDIERFLAFVNYHRTFVKDFAVLAQPLYSPTGKNKFHWGEEQQNAFEGLRKALTEQPVLALPNSMDAFIPDTDVIHHYWQSPEPGTRWKRESDCF